MERGCVTQNTNLQGTWCGALPYCIKMAEAAGFTERKGFLSHVWVGQGPTLVNPVWLVVRAANSRATPRWECSSRRAEVARQEVGGGNHTVFFKEPIIQGPPTRPFLLKVSLLANNIPCRPCLPPQGPGSLRLIDELILAGVLSGGKGSTSQYV